MPCTGPYTRVLFDTGDAKAARALVDDLGALGYTLTVHHLPQGVAGLDDFALDVDIPTPDNADARWEIRAAKYQGPKKLLGRSHIFDVAVRRRDAARGPLQTKDTCSQPR